MKFKLEMNIDNAAFADGNAKAEIIRIMKVIAIKLEVNANGKINDVNGNRIGFYGICRKNHRKTPLAYNPHKG